MHSYTHRSLSAFVNERMCASHLLTCGSASVAAPTAAASRLSSVASSSASALDGANLLAPMYDAVDSRVLSSVARACSDEAADADGAAVPPPGAAIAGRAATAAAGAARCFTGAGAAVAVAAAALAASACVFEKGRREGTHV